MSSIRLPSTQAATRDKTRILGRFIVESTSPVILFQPKNENQVIVLFTNITTRVHFTLEADGWLYYSKGTELYLAQTSTQYHKFNLDIHQLI
jgi:hypothetical protein